MLNSNWEKLEPLGMEIYSSINTLTQLSIVIYKQGKKYMVFVYDNEHEYNGLLRSYRSSQEALDEVGRLQCLYEDDLP